MESRAKIAGHAIHPMLIVFPLGLLGMSVVFDVITMVTHNCAFSVAASYMIAAGAATGLLAAVFGWIDWSAIPARTRAKRVGLWHAIGNMVVIAMFAGSFLLRWSNTAEPPMLALILSFAGAALMMVTGWLGGELVERMGVSIDPNAGLNAPSSLAKPTPYNL